MEEARGNARQGGSPVSSALYWIGRNHVNSVIASGTGRGHQASLKWHYRARLRFAQDLGCRGTQRRGGSRCGELEVPRAVLGPAISTSRIAPLRFAAFHHLRQQPLPLGGDYGLTARDGRLVRWVLNLSEIEPSISMQGQPYFLPCNHTLTRIAQIRRSPARRRWSRDSYALPGPPHSKGSV